MRQQPQRGLHKENMYFLPGDRYLAPIGVKICTMVELCPTWGFSTFGDDIFRGLQIGGQKCFWTICLRRSFGTVTSRTSYSSDRACHL